MPYKTEVKALFENIFIPDPDQFHIKLEDNKFMTVLIYSYCKPTTFQGQCFPLVSGLAHVLASLDTSLLEKEKFHFWKQREIWKIAIMTLQKKRIS